MVRHSATTPWPAKAASPWISTGSTEKVPGRSIWSWRARTMPSTTGSTASRCDGVGGQLDLDVGARPADVLARPRRGGTSRRPSPAPRSGRRSPRTPGRSGRSSCRRCWPARSAGRGGPCRAPRRRARRRRRHRARCRGSGWPHSAPSSPKRFVPTYLVARNFSKASAALSRLEQVAELVVRELDLDALDAAPGSSAARRCPGCACTRCRSCGSRRRAARGAGRPASCVSRPATPPVRNSRSRSQMVSP